MIQDNFLTATSTVVQLSFNSLQPFVTYSIYCLTTSMAGEIMPYNIMLKNNVSFETTCCRMINIGLSLSTTLSTSVIENAATLAISSAPSDSVTARLFFTDRTGTTRVSTSLISIFPTQITFTKTTTTLTTSSFTISGIIPGSYKLGISLTGNSAAEFQVSATNSLILNVSSVLAAAPPKLVSAIFLADGSAVTLTFDQATNRGGYLSSFPCRALLNFTGISLTSCSWQDDLSILLTQSKIVEYPSASLLVGSVITLMQNNTVSAKCLATYSTCPTRRAAAASIVIAAPASPVKPVVIVNAPSSISSCSDLTLDVSSSTGSAGRSWYSYSFVVYNSATYNNGDLLGFLTGSSYSLIPASSIASSYLRKGSVYSFDITLCNFLRACGTSRVQVTVANSSSTLSLAILGSQQLSMLPKDTVLIQSDASIITCGQTTKPSSTSIKYDWKIAYTNGSVVSGISSISQNPSIFRLSAFSLIAGRSYVVTLSTSVLVGSNKLSSTKVVTIDVSSDVLQAVVSAPSKILQVGSFMLIDGSSSLDWDDVSKKGLQAGLRFQWTCAQISPVFNGSYCPLKATQKGVLSVKTNTNLLYQVLNITSSSIDSATNATAARVYLTVTKGGRTSTSSVDVMLRSSVAKGNLVNVSSVSGSQSNFNTGNGLVLLGSLSIKSSCTAQWSVDDPQLNLNNISLTSTSANMRALGAPQSLYLSLKANSLPTGTTLTFSL
eukprot:gene16455-18671_t